jgi:hypothetical protein
MPTFSTEENMNRIVRLAVALVCFLTLPGICIAAEGYDMLFKGTTSKLSKEEKKQIFKKLGFRLSKDKKFIVDSTCGEDVSPSVEIIDLNGDGVEEVFVSWGNTCTSGMAGQSVTLFVKDRNGHYVENLGFPGIYEKLSTRNKGFPDLLIGGPGFCFAVWQWNGSTYEYKCSREEEPGGCSRKGIKSICK